MLHVKQLLNVDLDHWAKIHVFSGIGKVTLQNAIHPLLCSLSFVGWMGGITKDTGVSIPWLYLPTLLIYAVLVFRSCSNLIEDVPDLYRARPGMQDFTKVLGLSETGIETGMVVLGLQLTLFSKTFLSCFQSKMCRIYTAIFLLRSLSNFH